MYSFNFNFNFISQLLVVDNGTLPLFDERRTTTRRPTACVTGVVKVVVPQRLIFSDLTYGGQMSEVNGHAMAIIGLASSLSMLVFCLWSMHTTRPNKGQDIDPEMKWDRGAQK